MFQRQITGVEVDPAATGDRVFHLQTVAEVFRRHQLLPRQRFGKEKNIAPEILPHLPGVVL